MRLTKQGVRDLNTGTQKPHEHKFVPTIRYTMQGREVSQMECYCGEVYEEDEKEKEVRQLDALDRALDRAAQW